MGEAELYGRASCMADMAMGERIERGYRGSPRYSVRVAEDDPLAWWLLTERIADLAKMHKHGKPHP